MYAVIIGAQRSATTWLYEQLVQHPGVSGWNLQREPVWARTPREGPLGSLGNTVLEPGLQLAIDAWKGVVLQKATRWLTTPGTAKRLKEQIPEARVIMIGRDMTDRAWSHYRYTFSQNKESLSYRQALAEEAARIQCLSRSFSHFYAYTGHSSYPVHLRENQWLELFEHNIFLARTSELDEDQGSALLKSLCEWLGLDSAGLPAVVEGGIINEGEEFRNLITSDVMECQDALAWKFDQLEAEWYDLWRDNRGIKTPPSEDEGAETREGEQE